MQESRAGYFHPNFSHLIRVHFAFPPAASASSSSEIAFEHCKFRLVEKQRRLQNSTCNVCALNQKRECQRCTNLKILEKHKTQLYEI